MYYSKHEFDNALENYNKSLKIQLDTLSDNHPDVAASYGNVGIVYCCTGEYEKALDYYNKSLTINVSALGDSHPSVVSNRQTIAMLQAEIDKSS